MTKDNFLDLQKFDIMNKDNIWVFDIETRTMHGMCKCGH